MKIFKITGRFVFGCHDGWYQITGRFMFGCHDGWYQITGRFVFGCHDGWYQRDIRVSCWLPELNCCSYVLMHLQRMV